MEATYNFVYMNKIDKKAWDAEYQKLLGTITQTKNDYEYYRELQRFCAMLHDGHTNVFLPDDIEPMRTMFGDYRFFIEEIDGKAIITRVNKSKAKEVPPGSEVVAVNGLTTQQYIDKFVKPYIESSTGHILQSNAVRNMFESPEGVSYNVSIKIPANRTINLKLTHSHTSEKEVLPDFEPEKGLMELKWLKGGIAHLSLNYFGDWKIVEEFKTKVPELQKAKGLIIDLRYNGGGSTNIGTAILDYFVNDTILYGSRSSSKQYIATHAAWGVHLTPADTINGKPDWGMDREEATKIYKTARNEVYFNFPYNGRKTQYKGAKIIVPTVLLIGNNTASAAEDFLIYADKQKHMVKIGQRTYGSTGQPLMLELPGGASARICTKKDTYPDGREFVGVGVIPDIEVTPTVKDYLNKKDPALNKAVENINSRLKK